MKKFLWIVFVLFGLVSCEDVKIITTEELPVVATAFITRHFENDQIDYIVFEKEGFESTYNIILSSGYRLEFQKDGTCKKVDCSPLAIPDAIIPDAALQYVHTTFPDALIVKYELESKKSFQLKLNNEIGLEFSTDGQFIKMDD